MNITQLNNIIEIEKTGSITKAAENMFIGQPNLSRSLHELETELGFDIFKRSPKGMIPTLKGEEVLLRARRILAQVADIESLAAKEIHKQQIFNIVVPHASYISQAFTKLTASLNLNIPMQLDYKETDTVQAIRDIVDRVCDIGIVRYQKTQEDFYSALFKEKNLQYEEISSFTYHVMMSEKNPVAAKKELTTEDLKGLIEVIHGNLHMNMYQSKSEEIKPTTDKCICVYDRGSQFDLLGGVPSTYMWVSPVPKELLARYQLMIKPCVYENMVYKDVMIFRKKYALTEMDKRFIDELISVFRQLKG